jgi:hypothetical protein
MAVKQSEQLKYKVQAWIQSPAGKKAVARFATCHLRFGHCRSCMTYADSLRHSRKIMVADGMLDETHRRVKERYATYQDALTRLAECASE